VTALFMPLLVTHVVVSVLGLGSILSIALVAATVRRSRKASADVSAWLGPLLRMSGWSLAAMLLTGVLMDVLARGAFHEWWWFRGSALLLIVTGALHGQARRAARGLNADDGGGAALRRVERLAYGMTVLVAAIAVLMEAKPF
jgi:hypothetical protein